MSPRSKSALSAFLLSGAERAPRHEHGIPRGQGLLLSSEPRRRPPGRTLRPTARRPRPAAPEGRVPSEPPGLPPILPRALLRAALASPSSTRAALLTERSPPNRARERPHLAGATHAEDSRLPHQAPRPRDEALRRALRDQAHPPHQKPRHRAACLQAQLPRARRRAQPSTTGRSTSTSSPSSSSPTATPT